MIVSRSATVSPKDLGSHFLYLHFVPGVSSISAHIVLLPNMTLDQR